MSYQKTNLLLAPDIANLINSNLGNDSFLDRKGLLSYMIEKITIPFSRDVIIKTFLSSGGIINLDVFDNFFDVFYPLLVRVYLFSLLKFPMDESSLLDSLKIVKDTLMNHISSNPQAKILSHPHDRFSFNIFACTDNNARSNSNVYGFINPNKPIIVQHKQYRTIPGKESNVSIIRLATLISETYGYYPIISTHYYPPQIDENELEDFSILVQRDIRNTNPNSLRLQYQYLAGINIKNARILFETEDWKCYKNTYLFLQDWASKINANILSKYNQATKRITEKVLDSFHLLPNERFVIQKYISMDTACSMTLSELNKNYKITSRPNKVITTTQPTHLQKLFDSTQPG